jgi:TRAP-type C4-dicarboxylate transport system substrate-binding protein
MPPRCRLACLILLAWLAPPLVPGVGLRAEDAPPIRIKVLGGLAGVSQYTRYEAPFWQDRVPALTAGRLLAEIAPFDASGVRGQELLQLVRLGVVPFGTVLLGLAAADEPELNGVDLPILSPDIASLGGHVAAWRPRLAALLQERYGVRLLAIYIYPAQVMFCRGAFGQLGDLAGRRVRVSSVSQAELMAALGAVPLVIPFADIVPAIRRDSVNCAITGALSGNALGLQEVTTHISPVAISWGVSVAVVNESFWAGLPAGLRDALAGGLAALEAAIWQGAHAETADGLACNAGRPGCQGGRPGRMIIVEDRPENALHRQQLLRESVLPAWIRRCGEACVASWNAAIGRELDLPAKAE